MIRAAIVDTNVVVAGLLTGRTDSPVVRVLDGMLAAAFPFVVSDALLAEYRKVLLRPELRKAHGLKTPEVETLLLDLARHANHALRHGKRCRGSGCRRSIPLGSAWRAGRSRSGHPRQSPVARPRHA